MQVFIQSAEGLITGILAFLLGLLWQRINKIVLNHRARRFWRPVMSKDVKLVVSRFRRQQGFEASGLIGAGDVVAMHNLSRYFTQIGFRSFDITFNDQLGYGDTLGRSLRADLILLGGPDSNTLTNEVVKHLSLGISFKEIYPSEPDVLLEPRISDPTAATSPDGNDSKPSPVIRGILRRIGMASEAEQPREQWRIPVIFDVANKELYKPVKKGDQIVTDCGVIIRAPNPFDESKTVVILCGSYGYGTWEAVQYAQSREFLSQIPHRSEPLECVFTVDVVRDTPQRRHPKFVRRSPEQGESLQISHGDGATHAFLDPVRVFLQPLAVSCRGES
jgi:hypothetical protein